VIFVYDKEGQLMGEYNQTGQAIREYVWFENMPVAMFTPDPAAAANPPLIYFIHPDHLNTPRVVIDKANKIRWRWLAEPFGTTAPETNPSALGIFTQPLRFPGQYADAESTLFYNWNRYYDPSTGRYIESDPIGLAGGLNTFVYVGGNPVSKVDSFGLFECGGGMRRESTNQPGVWRCIPDSSVPDTPRCITAECAAGLLPAPIDGRSQSQVDQDLCEFVCGLVSPDDIIPGGFTIKKLAKFFAEKAAVQTTCKWVCKPKDGFCKK
jgi:RHS repeat-associated protein